MVKKVKKQSKNKGKSPNSVVASTKGVLHSPLGKPGNQAFDNVVRKIKSNPGAYSSSGMGSRTNISDKH